MTDRTPLIAGNWKMNLTGVEASALVRDIAAGIGEAGGFEVLVAPPFTLLEAARAAARGAGIFLAAQNMHFEMKGAFTGEVSGRMLQEAGCTHVILGHSERRALFHETDEIIDLKAKTAGMLGLIPIVCVGETLEDREGNRTFEVIETQLAGSLHNYVAGAYMPPATILAYEPVWAIGTGETATPEQAQEVHARIRGWIETTFDAATARQVRILYGGSVKAGNAADLMAEPDIDGSLVGGAALKAESFLGIIRASL